MNKLATVIAVAVLVGTPAFAADLGLTSLYKSPPPPPPPIQDWSGIYVGVEGGYGWGHQRFDQAFDPFFKTDPVIFQPAPSPVPFIINDPTISSVHQRGWLGGGFGGVQKQWGSWVLGLEAGIDGADIKGSSTATNSQSCVDCLRGGIIALVPVPTRTVINQSQTINSKIDELGFAGPKVGWAFSPNWLIYGIGGLAWAHQEVNASQTQTVQTCIITCVPFSGGDFDFSRTQSGGLTTFGWAAGVGIDYKWQIDPGSAVIFGVKYLHYGFGNNTLTLADNQFGSGFSNAVNTNERVDVVTGRISYFFSTH